MKSCPKCNQNYPGGVQFCPTDGTRLQLGQAPVKAETNLGHDFGGRYKLHRILGQGGLGVVYEAQHVQIGRRVAIKVLREEVSKNETVLERFRQEAKSASRIGHENIVDIIDFGETAYGAPYLVMEMLEGEDLAHLLKRERELPIETALTVLIQCCRALGAAHEKGIVHRDMKPENIFLTSREGNEHFVKIVDFGIAKMNDLEQPGEPGRKLTKTGMIFGTPEYMSPEQAAGKPSDHRVDIYALGIILFEIVCGRVPFLGDSFMAVLSQHLLEPVPRVHDLNPAARLPPALDAVIQRALQKHPDHRYQSMDDLARDLESILEGGEGVSPPTVSESAPALQSLQEETAITTFTETPSKPPRRWGMVWLALSMLVVGVAAWGISGLIPGPTAPETSVGDASVMENARPDAAVVPADAEIVPLVSADASELPLGVDPVDAEVAEPERVALRIVTQPAGARLVSPRLGCSSTPCTVRVRLGSTLRLQLSARGKLGRRRVRVEEDGQVVRVRMQNCCRRVAGLQCIPGEPECLE